MQFYENEFSKIKQRYENEVLTDEEFELFNNLYDVEYINSYDKYYGMYKYSILSEDREDYFDFYYTKGEN